MAKRPDQRSPQAERYRRLYNTARWKRTRAAQLASYPLCAMCLEAGREQPAFACDHVDPASKETDFFGGPFQSLCEQHHNITKQRSERAGYPIGCDAAGRPRDPAHPWNRAR